MSKESIIDAIEILRERREEAKKDYDGELFEFSHGEACGLSFAIGVLKGLCAGFEE